MSRELDGQVAIAVFNAPKRTYLGSVVAIPPFPAYSSSWEACREVVEKLPPVVVMERESDGTWDITIYHLSDKLVATPLAGAEGETLPEAVCNAALIYFNDLARTQEKPNK